MFHGKLHDEEDDELPRYEEEEDEVGERPAEGIVEEVEEIVVEEDGGDEEAPAAARDRAQSLAQSVQSVTAVAAPVVLDRRA